MEISKCTLSLHMRITIITYLESAFCIILLHCRKCHDVTTAIDRYWPWLQSVMITMYYYVLMMECVWWLVAGGCYGMCYVCWILNAFGGRRMIGLQCFCMMCCVVSRWQQLQKIVLRQRQLPASVVGYCHQLAAMSLQKWTVMAAAAATTTTTIATTTTAYMYMLVLAFIGEVVVKHITLILAVLELTVTVSVNSHYKSMTIYLLRLVQIIVSKCTTVRMSKLPTCIELLWFTWISYN